MMSRSEPSSKVVLSSGDENMVLLLEEMSPERGSAGDERGGETEEGGEGEEGWQGGGRGDSLESSSKEGRTVPHRIECKVEGFRINR